VAFAQQLDFQEASSRLQQILDEEKAVDAKLAQLAETVINPSRGQKRRAPRTKYRLKINALFTLSGQGVIALGN
jgi:hypothetical protein